ncbi:hypothetical protein RIF29_14923 [Crotalaria pallida]|uniref:Bet v I/Major latex protein domain-containing protein n=1 Tax=Crotalaria pallida TaxID=3830 RepID=A0AAN9FEA7_CROPI
MAKKRGRPSNQKPSSSSSTPKIRVSSNNVTDAIPIDLNLLDDRNLWIVKEVWDSEVAGYKMYQVMQKLKLLRKGLSQLNKDKFRCIDKQELVLREQLDQDQANLSVDPVCIDMALSGKVETEIEIQAPAAKFFDIFRKQLHKLPEISKDKIHGAKVHEGDWENIGSVKHWDYTIEGKKTTHKSKIEAIDDENKSITYSIFDAKVSESYKSLKATLQVIDKGNGGIVKWTFEYEKLKENITAASPESFLDIAVNVTKDIDAHLVKA